MKGDALFTPWTSESLDATRPRLCWNLFALELTGNQNRFPGFGKLSPCRCSSRRDHRLLELLSEPHIIWVCVVLRVPFVEVGGKFEGNPKKDHHFFPPPSLTHTRKISPPRLCPKPTNPGGISARSHRFQPEPMRFGCFGRLRSTARISAGICRKRWRWPAVGIPPKHCSASKVVRAFPPRGTRAEGGFRGGVQFESMSPFWLLFINTIPGKSNN